MLSGALGGITGAGGELISTGIGAWGKQVKLNRIGKQLDNMAAETQDLIRQLDDNFPARSTPGNNANRFEQIADPWLSPVNSPVRSNPAGSFDPHPVPSNVPEPIRILASSAEPGTIISRVPSRQAHSKEIVTIQGKHTTFKAGDKLVPEIVSAMEAKNPGVIQGVENIMYKTDGSMEILTDLDIVTQNAIFQVKTGKATGLVKQLKNTAIAAQGRKVVGIVTSEANAKIIREARSEGYEVIVIPKKGKDINTVVPQIINATKRI